MIFNGNTVKDAARLSLAGRYNPVAEAEFNPHCRLSTEKEEKLPKNQQISGYFSCKKPITI